MGAEGHIPPTGQAPQLVRDERWTDRWKRKLALARSQRERSAELAKPRFTFERISQRTYMVTDRRGQPLGMLTQLPGGDWMAGGESLGKDRRRAARVLEKAAAKARIRAAKEERR